MYRYVQKHSQWYDLVKSLHTELKKKSSLPIAVPSSFALFMKIKATQDLKVKSTQKLTVSKAWSVFNWHFCLCPSTIKRKEPFFYPPIY